jgi:bifunctional ADP-heptose synthase (sugar kinase/adenylyltransferase)
MTELDNIQRQTPFKILLLGDNCTDVYNIGVVDRLSPEAPVPVVKIVESYSVPGMASNVYQNLINLGCEVRFITNRSSITKTRFIDQRSGQHLLRVDDHDAAETWNQELPDDFIPNAVVISDYNKGFLSYADIQRIIETFNVPVFIDTKKQNLDAFNGAYVKINESEYRNSTSQPDKLIVTLGSKGAMYVHNNEEMVYPTDPVEVMDVCGCGDTFLASLTLQYLYTKDIEKAIIIANVAAGITAQHRGNYAPTREEIHRA